MSNVSSLLWQILPIFLTFLFASQTTFARSAKASYYAQHCSSIAPESSPTKRLFGASNSFLISEGVFSSENRINNLLAPQSKRNTSIHAASSSGIFNFKTDQVHRTRDANTLQVEGTLSLLGSQVPIRSQNKTSVWRHEFRNHSGIVFKLSGFWSEAKGKLCMIGTGEIRASTLSVVLKLEYPNVSTITTSVIEGSIESLDMESSPAYLERISLLAYAQRRYKYTMTEQAEESCSHHPREESVAWDKTFICSKLENTMRYEMFTSNTYVNFLGFRFLSTSQFSCSGDGLVHLSMILSNKRTSSLNRTPTKLLVAEGVWDHRNSRLCLLACGIIGKENSSYSVRDCSIGLTFWFPASFSLKQQSTVVGRIWNTSDTSSNDANSIVSLYSTYSDIEVPGLKYEYTKLDDARKYCKIKNFNPKRSGRYPNAQSYMDMSFQLSYYGKNGKYGWGNGWPIAVGETYLGDKMVHGITENTMLIAKGTTNSASAGLANQTRIVWDVGYTLYYTIWDEKNVTNSVDIFAEGMYNSVMGTLCLIGCKRPNFNYTINDEILNTSVRIDDRKLDCTLLIKLQLPLLTSRNKAGNGTIESTRANSDPFYFEPFEVKLFLTDTSYSIQESNRMDAEVIMVIISLTFLCICSYMQLRHVRKNIDIRPLISITMIVLLILGCIVSLILNIEVMFVPANKQQVFLQNGGWVDTTNAIVRLITLVALLIDFRLLQLAWGSRLKDKNTQVISWRAEKKSLMFCAFPCVMGALVAWFAHSHAKYHQTITEDLERYVGLVLDNFLLPQIIFNVFSQSKEKVLDPFFYVGTTMVRAMPHIYNAYRVWWHPAPAIDYDASYIYANHSEDYYSTLCDIIFPCEGLLFVFLVLFQQWFGGRCFLPERFRHNNVDYEPVYVSDI